MDLLPCQRLDPHVPGLYPPVYVQVLVQQDPFPDQSWSCPPVRPGVEWGWGPPRVEVEQVVELCTPHEPEHLKLLLQSLDTEVEVLVELPRPLRLGSLETGDGRGGRFTGHPVVRGLFVDSFATPVPRSCTFRLRRRCLSLPLSEVPTSWPRGWTTSTVTRRRGRPVSIGSACPVASTGATTPCRRLLVSGPQCPSLPGPVGTDG